MSEAKLSPEERIAVLCAGIELDDRTKFQVEEILKRGIDWKRLTALLGYHHITALVYHNIRKICPEAIPVELPVKEKIDECIVRNIILSRELETILSSFRETGLSAIPIKGIYLLNTLYADLPLREMYDIDILIRDKDLPEADRCIRESGYLPEDQTFDWRDLSVRKYYRKLFYHLRYKKASPRFPLPVILEIHFDILPLFRNRSAFLSDIWEDSRDVNSSGISSLAMSTEDLLIYLSLKLFADFEFFLTLKNLCDISELIKRHNRQIGWNVLIKKAKLYNAASMLYYCLCLTQGLLMDGNNLIPKNVTGELKPAFLKRIFLDHIIRRDKLAEAADNKIPMIAFMREYLFDIMSIRGIPDICRLIRNVLYDRNFYERLFKMPGYKRGFAYLIRFLKAPVLLINLFIRSLRRNPQ